MPKSFRTFFASMLVMGASHAGTLTADFTGETGILPGIPGDGDVSGSIIYDTANAVFESGGLFLDVVSSINIVVSGVSVTSAGSPTENTFSQTVTGVRDAFTSNYEGSFGSIGAIGEVESVYFEIRMADGEELFSAPDNLLDELTSGQLFDLSDYSFVSLVISYIDEPGDPTILRINDFDSLNLTYVAAPVPLPAGLPLALMGLASLGLMRRRKV